MVMAYLNPYNQRAFRAELREACGSLGIIVTDEEIECFRQHAIAQEEGQYELFEALADLAGDRKEEQAHPSSFE